MTQKKLYILLAAFVGLGILANWFWFPGHLIVGGSIIAILAGVAVAVVAIRNTIEEADKNASE